MHTQHEWAEERLPESACDGGLVVWQIKARVIHRGQGKDRDIPVRIIIIGAGEVGYHIASRLIREQHDIVVVDQSAELIERVQEELDVMAFRGHGASPSTLEGAGISQTDMLIAVTSSDEVNLVDCLLARQYG